MSEVLKKFKEDFEEVKSKGFIKSHRAHNTGIGKTFEDLVNVEENNKQDVDYLDELELKSSRDLSGSMVTLFTKAPSYPKGANTQLRDKFGEKKGKIKELHTTISGNKFNTFKNKYGFRLKINVCKRKIFILIKDLKSDTLIDYKCYYTFKDLKKIIDKKCKNIAFISANSKKIKGQESFHFQKAVLLTGLTFRKFLKAISKEYIFYDIRYGSYKSGKMNGKSHDHGSGFRIKKTKIKEVFKVTEI
jgi:hypothetical protein